MILFGLILSKIPTDCRPQGGKTKTERSGGAEFSPFGHPFGRCPVGTEISRRDDPLIPLPLCPRSDGRKFRRRHCYFFFFPVPFWTVFLNLPSESLFGVCFFGIILVNTYFFYKLRLLTNHWLRRRPLEKTSYPLA